MFIVSSQKFFDKWNKSVYLAKPSSYLSTQLPNLHNPSKETAQFIFLNVFFSSKNYVVQFGFPSLTSAPGIFFSFKPYFPKLN